MGGLLKSCQCTAFVRVNFSDCFFPDRATAKGGLYSTSDLENGDDDIACKRTEMLQEEKKIFLSLSFPLSKLAVSV